MPDGVSFFSVPLHLVWPTIPLVHNEVRSHNLKLPKPYAWLWPGSLLRTVRGHVAHPSTRGFLKIPVVKFMLRALLHLLYLGLYAAKLSQNLALPHLETNAVDYAFYAWTLGLWLDEVHQWKDDLIREERHFDSLWNVYGAVPLAPPLAASAPPRAFSPPSLTVSSTSLAFSHPLSPSPSRRYDVVLWTSILGAGATKIVASNTCTHVGIEGLYAARGLQASARRVATFDYMEDGAAVVRRLLRGSTGGGSDDHESMTGLYGGQLDIDSTEDIFFALYDGCFLLFIERLILAFGFVAATVRILQWLKIPNHIGVIAIIIGELATNLFIFTVFAAMFVVSTGVALVGLMPLHGSAAFNADGAFMMPLWAMYGEFGDIREVIAWARARARAHAYAHARPGPHAHADARARRAYAHACAQVGMGGGVMGSTVLWGYTFVVQIVLVNLLIAMLTETYERVQMSATDEWRYQRVSIVDEFASTPNVPAPLSMPLLILELSKTLGQWLRGFDLRETSDELVSSEMPRIFDSVSQREVNMRLNASPDLLWMQAHLEGVEKGKAHSISYKLDALTADRERVYAPREAREPGPPPDSLATPSRARAFSPPLRAL